MFQAWFCGEVLKFTGADGISIRKLCDKITDDPRVTAVMVDITDGDYIAACKN